MNTEDKIFLAKHLGHGYEPGLFTYVEWFNDWDPDTNLDAFKKVWEKLTLSQQEAVTFDTKPGWEWNDYPSGAVIFIVNRIITDLPEVMVDIIKELKKECPQTFPHALPANSICLGCGKRKDEHPGAIIIIKD